MAIDMQARGMASGALEYAKNIEVGGVKVSQESGNLIESKSDGLYAKADLSDYYNKQETTNLLDEKAKQSDLEEEVSRIDEELADRVKEEQFNTLSEKVAEIELFKFPNAIIHGEPTINNGQISGFSNANYLVLPSTFDLSGRGFEFKFAFTTKSDVSTSQNILGSKYCMALFVQNGKLNLRVSSNGTSWDLVNIEGSTAIQPNKTYYAKISFSRLNYVLSLSTDDESYSEIGSKSVGDISPNPSKLYIGVGNNFFNPFLGIINLNKCYLKVNQSIIWQGMDDVGLTTRLATDLENIDEVGIENIKGIIKDEYIDRIDDTLSTQGDDIQDLKDNAVKKDVSGNVELVGGSFASKKSDTSNYVLTEIVAPQNDTDDGVTVRNGYNFSTMSPKEIKTYNSMNGKRTSLSIDNGVTTTGDVVADKNGTPISLKETKTTVGSKRSGYIDIDSNTGKIIPTIAVDEFSLFDQASANQRILLSHEKRIDEVNNELGKVTPLTFTNISNDAVESNEFDIEYGDLIRFGTNNKDALKYQPLGEELYCLLQVFNENGTKLGQFYLPRYCRDANAIDFLNRFTRLVSEKYKNAKKGKFVLSDGEGNEMNSAYLNTLGFYASTNDSFSIVMSKAVSGDDNIEYVVGNLRLNAYVGYNDETQKIETIIDDDEGFDHSDVIYQNQIVLSKFNEKIDNIDNINSGLHNRVLGKNLFNQKLIVNSGSLGKWIHLQLKPNTSYTMSTDCTVSGSALVFFLSGNVETGTSSENNGVWNTQSITTMSDENGYISICYRLLGSTDPANYNWQVEEGTSATSYEMYVDNVVAEVSNINSGLYNLAYGENSGNRNLAKDYIVNNVSTPFSNALLINCELKPNTTYTLSFLGANGSKIYPNENIFTSTGDVTVGTNRVSMTLTTKSSISKSEGAQYVDGHYRILKISGGNSVAVSFSNVQIEEGSSATDYEPYIMSNKQLTSANASLDDYGFNNKVQGFKKGYIDGNTGQFIDRYGNYMTSTNSINCSPNSVIRFVLDARYSVLFVSFYNGSTFIKNIDMVDGKCVAPANATNCYVSAFLQGADIDLNASGRVYVDNAIDEIKAALYIDTNTTQSTVLNNVGSSGEYEYTVTEDGCYFMYMYAGSNTTGDYSISANGCIIASNYIRQQYERCQALVHLRKGVKLKFTGANARIQLYKFN